MKNDKYLPQIIEKFWRQRWEQNNYFSPSNCGLPYCIILPPPNVTGTLHMGHGFQISIMDALIRYHRMRGYNTLWQLGTDHAGIATQMVVENLIKSEGMTKQQLGRDGFNKKAWDWKIASEKIITTQQQRMGISGDWSRTKFTLDPDLVEAVQTSFIKLYEDGLIYRGKRLVNWDPVLGTSLSDLEVINKECNGFLWYINYPLVDSNQKITIATTRPETLLGDVAVAVHPKDERYKNFIGKRAILPLTNRIIPIITDEAVDPNFGTGCVKITPAHDFNDYAMGKHHSLPLINIFTKNGHINTNAPAAYHGLDRFEARAKIVEDLTSMGLIVKTLEHELNIPLGDRTGAIVEPYLTDQWFIDTKQLAIPAIQALHDQKIRFIPENWGKIYLQWLENIEDWCISRQLWWGHQIPAWYDNRGNIYVGKSEEEVRMKFNLKNENLQQDEDVLDTWFSSALWPFSSLGWPINTKELQTFYPTSVLVTGFDIIFFWVARMVMFGLKFIGKVPFRDVYITGLIRDAQGQKMSKSKGNILDPIDLVDGISLNELVTKRTSHLMQKHLITKIEQQTRKEFPHGIAGFGTDALRFTFCSLATQGRDINFDMARLEGYRNFCTKLWNASRFVNIQLDSNSFDPNQVEYSVADRWIVSELHRSIKIIEEEFSNYRFDLVTQTIYEFTWHQFCDWYLELAKPMLSTNHLSSAALKNGTCRTMGIVLETLLRVIHPFMPFITEELWQNIAPKLALEGKSIMLEKYPAYEPAKLDSKVTNEIEWIKKIIISIRNIRGEMNIAPSKPLTLILRKGNQIDHERINNYEYIIKWLAKIKILKWLDSDESISLSSSAIIEQLELYLEIDDLDFAAEQARLTKHMDILKQEINFLETKLNNANYLSRAPQNIVAEDRKKLLANKELLNKLLPRCLGNAS